MVAVNYLNTQKETITYKAGDIIFNAGDAGDLVYGVIDGRVQVVHGDYVIDVLAQGDVLGEEVMLGNKHYSLAAIAVTDVTLSVMKRHQFLWLVQQTPTFATQLMRAMSNRVEKVAQLLD
ncbi:MAG: cyclic nucleotide-binding domain-containing protein [Chloroflexota bacterium]